MIDDQFRQDFLKLKVYLIKFLRNPVESIQVIPVFHWPNLIALYLVSVVLCGVLTATVSLSWPSLIASLVILPVSSSVVLGTLTAFFYFFFALFLNIQANPKQLVSSIIFSALPFLMLHPLSPLLPPIDLIGLAFSSLLFVVAAVSHFDIARKIMGRLVLTLYLLFFCAWIISMVHQQNKDDRYLPTDLEELEESVRQGD